MEAAVAFSFTKSNTSLYTLVELSLGEIMLKNIVLTTLISVSLAACGHDHTSSDQPDTSPEVIEVLGIWASQWGTDIVTVDKWNKAAIVEFDNTTNTAITQEASDAEYNPGKFSRVVWTDIADGVFHYCIVVFGQESAEAAANSQEEADASDLNGEGCGGFPWTQLAPAIEVHGTWETEWGAEDITSHSWNSSTVVSYDNSANIAITQNPEDAEYNPGQYNKLVWTNINVDGTLHYCTVAYGHSTAEEAMAATDGSDLEDLDGEGCGGFKWTKLNPVE